MVSKSEIKLNDIFQSLQIKFTFPIEVTPSPEDSGFYYFPTRFCALTFLPAIFLPFKSLAAFSMSLFGSSI